MLNIFTDCIFTGINWTFITAVGTFAAALATFFTVIEIKRQREYSYHPELYLGNQDIYVYGAQHGDKFLPFIYSNEALQNINESGLGLVTTKLYNVGFAVAKAVEYTWSFDINNSIKLIDKVNSVGFFQVDYNRGIEITAPKIGYKGSFQFVENQLRKANINYILPASIEKTPSTIFIPGCYIDLYITFLCCYLGYYEDIPKQSKVENKHNIDIEDFTPLLLELRYKDLQGKIHLKKFSFRFRFNWINSPENLKEQREIGIFELTSTEL